MDGPRDYHTGWSKSDREREIYDNHLYVESKKVRQIYIQNRNGLMVSVVDLTVFIETNLWLPKGKGRVGREKIRSMRLTDTHHYI